MLKLKFDTKVVRASSKPDPTTGSIVPPLHQTATYVLEEVGRDKGFDWALIKLGCEGIISQVNIDTSHFTGNYPPEAKIYGCLSKKKPDVNSEKWGIIIPKVNLGPDQSNVFDSMSKNVYNWIKLEIYPDGGVARLRLYGKVHIDWKQYSKNNIYELSSLRLGGKIIYYNNAHYGNVNALITDGRGKNMGDGWETRRRREPGNDWIIISLGKPANIKSLEIDTAFFKGNYPHSCSVQGYKLDRKIDFSDERLYKSWPIILEKKKLFADSIHKFSKELINTDKLYNHIKLNIFPDGGVSRFRVFGKIE